MSIFFGNLTTIIATLTAMMHYLVSTSGVHNAEAHIDGYTVSVEVASANPVEYHWIVEHTVPCPTTGLLPIVDAGRVTHPVHVVLNATGAVRRWNKTTNA